jgi:hypothetical protein
MEYKLTYFLLGFVLTNSVNYFYNEVFENYLDSTKKECNYNKMAHFINNIKKFEINYNKIIASVFIHILENNYDNKLVDAFSENNLLKIKIFCKKYKIDLVDSDINEIIKILNSYVNEKYLLNA